MTKAHLRWATHAENEADKLIHGTSNRRGHKLTEADVHQIRALVGTLTHRKIAEQFGVSETQIWGILRGKAWAWLPGFLDAEIDRLKRGAPAEYRYVRYIPDDEPVVVPRDGWAR